MAFSLVDLKITKEQYEALPPADDCKYLPIGTYFKAKDGRVCQVVNGEDMFAHQAGACLFGLPMKGLRHYKPVFATAA